MRCEWITVRGIKTHIQYMGDETQPAIVLLHGFTGSVSTWQETAALLLDSFYIIAVDMIGHGQTEAPETPARYRIEEQISDLHQLLEKLGIVKPVLLGYSMGGRIALGYTAAYPEAVSCLVLESSSPGLRTAAEREARRNSDVQLAQRIENEGIEKFTDFWQEIPLFRSQRKMTAEQQQKVRQERLGQRPEGLANSLRGIGTGSQPSYWEQLDSLQLPVLLITGSDDHKFKVIAEKMVQMLPNARHETINGAGHAIHVEKPRQFATMVKNCLKTM